MAPPTASLIGSRRLSILVISLLVVGNAPVKALAKVKAGIESSAMVTPLIELPTRTVGRSLAQASTDSPAAHCVTKVNQLFGPKPCVSSNICRSASAPAGVMVYSGTGRAAGSVVPGIASPADCCTKCSEQKATCGGFQFVLATDLGSTGCHLLTASDCDAVDAVTTSFNGSPAGLVNAFCPPEAPVATSDCKPLTLTAGPECTAPTPSASDVYFGLTSQLASDVSLDQLIIDGNDNPPTTLAAGVHNYTLTASNRLAVSAPCQNTIEVLPYTTPPQARPPCNPTTVFLAATSGCAHSPPTVEDVRWAGNPLFPWPLEVAVNGNPESLLVGQEYFYSLTAIGRCGVRGAPCNGSIIIQDAEPLDANLITCPGVSTITNTNPAAFTATYLGGTSKANGCPVTVAIPSYPGGSPVKCDLCKKGRREAPNCLATASGNTLTITKNGGAGNHISWVVKAADAGPKSVETTCGVCVESQGKKGACVGNWSPGEPAPCL